jgi:hypothetical protein
MTFAQLYRSAVTPGPEASRLRDKEIAPALRRLAEAKRQGKLPSGIVDAEALATGSLPGLKLNRIGDLGKTGSPYHYVAYEEAIRLAGLFPEQFSQSPPQGAPFELALLVDQFWAPTALREAALDTLASIGNSAAFQDLERVVGWLDNENPSPDQDHWRREVLITLLRMNFSAAKHYIWEEVRKFSDGEATLAWQSILAQPDAAAFLADSIPENLREVSKVECALAVARQVGPSAAEFRDALERKLEQVKLK